MLKFFILYNSPLEQFIVDDILKLPINLVLTFILIGISCIHLVDIPQIRSTTDYIIKRRSEKTTTVYNLELNTFQSQNYYTIYIKKIKHLITMILTENLDLRLKISFNTFYILFIFLLCSNLFGLIPFTYALTACFLITFFIAFTFTLINFIMTVYYLGFNIIKLFVPGSTPLWIIPFPFIIETISYLARIFSLSIRLFANVMAGHTLLKILIIFVFNILTTFAALFVAAACLWAVIFAIICLEIFIMVSQAYIFTILCIIFLNDMFNIH